ncbi:hypothetical protein D3878_13190 [Noviherbaspirillum sedimenti]|uniref:Uncharacterized protein n=1 Tax=Noviherbaspirillum sedimenti TaxID=2320865 RepID=A0A3A3G3J1_9BURK|nr:hypothetical protein D3878_13190 [Noviherbaspirillum sedimenti]
MRLHRNLTQVIRQFLLPDLFTVRWCRWLLPALFVASVSGCAVVAVADAAVTVVATGVKVTAKAVGAAADVVIPDGDDK